MFEKIITLGVSLLDFGSKLFSQKKTSEEERDAAIENAKTSRPTTILDRNEIELDRRRRERITRIK